MIGPYHCEPDPALRPEANLVPREELLAGRVPEAGLRERDSCPFPLEHSAVVLEGDAGIGKTTVWRSALDELEARGVRVLSTRPAEAESQLSYAGLTNIRDPVLEGRARRAPAASAVRPGGGFAPRRARGRFAGSGGDRVRRARSPSYGDRGGPVVGAVDDIQWLDAPSRFALAFVAGRLRGEAVGFLLALRSEQFQRPALELERQLGEAPSQ